MGDRLVKIKLDADATGAVRGFASVKDAAAEAKAKMQESAVSQRKEWSTVGKGLTAVGVAVTGVGVAALKTGIQYNTLQQTTRAALSTLLGSAQAANAQMDKLDAFARNSPFSKQTFISAQQQMLAFGIETQKVIPYLDSVQNAVAAMGGSNQQISEISFIMSQISAASKITGQDLMQLGQRGINAAELIGSQMGKTGAQIRADITAGTLDADKALDALAAGMDAKFGGAAANVKNTFEGAMDRVKAAWRDFASELARPLVDPNGGGALVDLLNWTADAMRAFEDLPGPVKTSVSAFTGLVGVASLVGGTFMLAYPKVQEFKKALADVGGVASIANGGLARFANFLTGPWGVALMAAAAVVTVFATENARLSTQARELSETLEKSTGAITENSQAWAANQLQAEGVLSAAKRMGISAKDMTDAWLGNAEALGRVNARLDKFRKDAEFRMENADWKGWSNDLADLDHALDGSNKVLANAKVRHSELAEATKETTDATGSAVGPADDLSGAFQSVDGAAQDAWKGVSDLIDALNEFNGVGQSAEQANSRLQESIAKVDEHIKNVRDGVEGYSGSLDESTAAGASNRAMLASLAAETVKAASEQFEYEKKTLGATQAVENYEGRLATGRQKVLDMANALSGNADQAQKLTDKILEMPSSKDIRVLLNGVQEAEGALQSFIDRNSGRTITVNMALGERVAGANSRGGLTYASGGTIGFAQGGTIPGYANGDTVGLGGGVRQGTVWGVGTAKSDSITVNLSRGEEVIQEPYASRERPLLKAINRGDFVSSTQQARQVIVRDLVHVPTSVTVVDADNRMIGTMKVVANAEIDGFAGEQARAGRTAQY